MMLDEKARKAVQESMRCSATAGDALSQFYLGMCIFEARKSKADSAEAARLFLDAAQKGIHVSQYMLGIC